MHQEVLTKGQIKLLPFLKLFAQDFGLVGGTAIALHLGHRRSIDFDFFTNREFDNLEIRKKIQEAGKRIGKVFVDNQDEYTVLVDGVRLTFFYYPFKIKFTQKVDGFLKTADLLTLASLKAYALGRRAKWKDYVDLCFIMRDYFGIAEIIKKAKKIFSNDFNEKLFKTQLSYFKDLDYSEEIDYLKGFKMADGVIKRGLVEFSLGDK